MRKIVQLENAILLMSTFTTANKKKEKKDVNEINKLELYIPLSPLKIIVRSRVISFKLDKKKETQVRHTPIFSLFHVNKTSHKKWLISPMR